MRKNIPFVLWTILAAAVITGAVIFFIKKYEKESLPPVETANTAPERGTLDLNADREDRPESGEGAMESGGMQFSTESGKLSQ